MSYRSILTKGHFWKLWSSQAISLIAQNLLNYTLIIRVAELSRGTALENVSVALVIMAFGIPSILFAAVAGVYVDTWNRKQVLFVSNIIRAVLLVSYLFVETNLVLLLIVTFLVSTVTQFFAPAEAAAIPRLVAKKELVSANAMFVSTFYIAFIIGYVAAAPLLQQFGANTSYVIGSAMFVIGAVLISILPDIGGHHQEERAPSLAKGFHHMVSALRQNTKLILASRTLYFPIAQLMFVQAIISVLLVFAPGVSLALLKGPLKETSLYIVLPAAIGMAVGIATVRRLSGGFNSTIIMKVGILAAGLAMLGIGLAGQLYRSFGSLLPLSISQVSFVVAGLVLIVGLANSIVSVVGQTTLQKATVDEDRGKVFGALNMMLNIALTVPVFFAAVAADLLSVTKVMSIVGLLVVVIAFVQFLRRDDSIKLEDKNS
jgi:MFS family permease